MSKNPVLYALLLTLDNAELRRFGKFVRSPYFTHRTELAAMYACLAHCRYRQLDLPDKNTLFQKTFPGQNYDDLLLRATMSDLRELLEEFLLQQRLRKQEIQARLALAAEFRDRNLDKFFLQSIRKVEQLLNDAPVANADHLALVLELQLEKAHFQTRTIRAGELPLQDISNSLDTLYLAQKLRHACTQLSHQAVYKTSYDFGLLHKVLDAVAEGPYLQVPAIALYYYCYRFLTEQYSQAYFQQFRLALQQNGALFPDSELKNLYLLAINFCIRKLNTGDELFLREGWALYREGLERGFLLEHGRLSGFTFNNVAAFGIKMGAYEEVETFILKYAEHLEPVQREGFVAFNRARLEYARKHYEQALRLLQSADFKDLVNNLIAKTLLLKIYFELREFDLLDAHLENFRSFIRRREVSDYHRANYNNIIGMVRKLCALPPGNQPARQALQQEIKNTEILTEREWLLQQVAR